MISTSTKKSGQDTWYLYNKDVRGSTSSMVNETGELAAAYEYDDFGDTTVRAGADFDNEICYTGQIYDKGTGLYYYNARYYDPEDGRFITQDTYRGEQTDPGTWHLYAYCANNPISYIDPTGHKRLKKRAKIYLGVHKAFSNPLFYHACVIIFVGHKSKFYKDKRFINKTTKKKYGGTSKTPVKYVTFGGESKLEKGNLEASLNRPSDVDLSNKVVMKHIKTEKKKKTYTKKLLNRHDDFVTCPTVLKYRLFPTKTNKGYNSNSYAKGLLNAAGLSVEKPDKTMPGWGRPVPKANFGL